MDKGLTLSQFNSRKENRSKGGLNIGNAVGDFLGFDITPGYNMTWHGPVSNAKPKSNKSSTNVKSVSEPQHTGATTNDVASSYAATGGASDYNPADLAYLEDSRSRLQRQLQSADLAKRNGLTALNDSYNSNVSSANSDRGRALEDFSTKREDTTRAKDQAITKVDTSARTLADSLRRRIGMASGSGSSAYQITAPAAVARDASQNRTGVLENYGTNFRNLATAEDRAKSDFEKYLDQLEAEKKQRESDFLASVYDKQNDISSSLAEVARQEALLKGGGYDQVKQAMNPYVSQIDSRQSAIDNLFKKYRTPSSVQKVKVQAPQLSDYVVDNSTIKNAQQAGDTYAPYTYLPQDKKDDSTLSLY